MTNDTEKTTDPVVDDNNLKATPNIAVVETGEISYFSGLHLRFTMRNNPSKVKDDPKYKGTLSLGILLHENGMVCSMGELQGAPGETVIALMKETCDRVQASLREKNKVNELACCEILVSLPSRVVEREAVMAYLKGIDGEPDGTPNDDLTFSYGNLITIRIAVDEEYQPMPTASVQSINRLFSLPDLASVKNLPELVADLERNLRCDPNARNFPIRDDIAAKNEDRLKEACTRSAPVTAVVGAAGSGKSSLISSLMDLSGFDLPPSGLSRTTLCPISFTQDRLLNGFHLIVVFKPVEAIRAKIRERVEDCILATIRSKAPCTVSFSAGAKAFARSPDSTFDLQLMVGSPRASKKNMERMAFIQMIAERYKTSSDPEIEMRIDPLIDLATDDIVISIYNDLDALPFGELRRKSNAQALRSYTDDHFVYSSTQKRATVEAARRFFSASPAHAGKSFAPLCSSVSFCGNFIDSANFEIVDNRGFDHEGDMSQAAAADIMHEVENSSRVMIIEDAVKVGSRATMELVSQIIAAGHGAKIFFVQSKSDIVLNTGKDLDTHVAAGLKNGLSGLEARVGFSAIESIRKNIEKGLTYSFGCLDKFDPSVGGLQSAEPVEDIGIDNAFQARCLISHLSRSVAESNFYGLADIIPVFEYDVIHRAVKSALAAAWPAMRDRYGHDSDNAGIGSHWGTIKAENRRVINELGYSKGTIPTSDISGMTFIEAVSIAEHMSLVIDSPASWMHRNKAIEENVIDDLKDYVRNEIRKTTSIHAHHAMTRRLIVDRIAVWQEAYELTQLSFGPGSTFERARLLRSNIELLCQSAKGIADDIAHDLQKSGVKINQTMAAVSEQPEEMEV